MKQNCRAVTFLKKERKNLFSYPDDLEILETWICISSFMYIRVIRIENKFVCSFWDLLTFKARCKKGELAIICTGLIYVWNQNVRKCSDHDQTRSHQNASLSDGIMFCIIGCDTTMTKYDFFFFPFCIISVTCGCTSLIAFFLHMYNWQFTFKLCT